MKIRIIKKGIPKAQFGFSQIGDPSIDSKGLVWGANPGVVTKQETDQAFGECGPGMYFSLLQQTCLPVSEQAQEQQALDNFRKFHNKVKLGMPTNPFKTTGNEGTASNPMKPAVQPKSAPAANQGANSANQNGFEKFFGWMDRTLPWALGATELVNSNKRAKEFGKFMRRRTGADSMFPEVPTWMSGNRGDYVASGDRFGEFRPNDYVVNKGMYTSQFYPLMMATGGVIPDALAMPITPMQIPMGTEMTPPALVAPSSGGSSEPTSYRSSGANEEAEQTWEDISKEFQGVKHLGIWGDKKHQARKSDHNSGDALDIGIQNTDQGTQIAQKLIKEAQDRNVKYIIWNRQIWNPSESPDWRPYNGENPHTSHVHVSFNRNPESLGQISLTHNNPLNIHHGEFAEKYGGKQGSKDGSGFVSKFPDLNTGIKAAQDLLFGPNYADLTITQARNKWVNGNVNKPTNSSAEIVKVMGGDKMLKDLAPQERDMLIKLFAKWEGKQAYNKIKDMKLYKEGGSVSYQQGNVYELTDDEIRSILAAGGEVEFI